MLTRNGNTHAPLTREIESELLYLTTPLLGLLSWLTNGRWLHLDNAPASIAKDGLA